MKNLEKNQNNRVGLYIFSFIIIIVLGYLIFVFSSIPIEEDEILKEFSLPLNWFYFNSSIALLFIIFVHHFRKFIKSKQDR